MIILHVIASVDPRDGGPIEGITRQAAARYASGSATHIVSLDRPDDPWVTACPVKVFALGIRSAVYRRLQPLAPWLRYGYTPRLVPWLKRHAREYDIVVVNGLWNYSALGARRALIGSDVPYVVFTHGMLDPWFRKTYPLKHLVKQFFWWLSEGPLLSHARAVMFTSEDECVLARNAFWPYRCIEKVIGYGTADVTGEPEMQIGAFRRAVPRLGLRQFLLFLSRIHPKKGCDLLINAFARIAPAYPGLDLVIAGPDQLGWRNELETQAHALGVSGRIHWPGMLQGDLKWGALRSCEAFVLPSHQENFGIVVAEAMAAGRPVLITNKVNIWREVAALGGGLVAPDDEKGICSLLERYLALPPEEKGLMAQRAREGFLERFEVRKLSATIIGALQEAAAR